MAAGVRLTVSGLAGPLCTVQAAADWTIQQVHEAVARELDVPVGCQVLLRDVERLSPEMVVASLMQDGAADLGLTLVVRQDLVELAERYVKRAKRRNQDIDQVPRIQRTLFDVATFLQGHAVDSLSDATHLVWEGHDDWWCTGQEMRGKLRICEDDEVQELHHHILTCYDLGIPLFLTEKPSRELKFFQDIEVYFDGKTDAHAILPEDLINVDGPFMPLLGDCIGEIYKLDALDVAAFDASGFDRAQGRDKLSLRFVWQDLVVDRARYSSINDFVVKKFSNIVDEEIRSLEVALQIEEGLRISRHDRAKWRSVFPRLRSGVRMPFCDETSPPPLERREGRPLRPLGYFRFRYGEEGAQKLQDVWRLQEILQLCSGSELLGSEWLKMGSVHQPPGTPLTDWHAPGEVPWHWHRYDFIRAQRPPPVITVEREFVGALEAFKEVLQRPTIRGRGVVKLEGDILIWSQHQQGGASLEFNPANNRVRIKGTAFRVRPLLVRLAKYVETVGQAAKYA